MNLSLLVFKTNDIEKLKSFYEILGLEFIKEQHGTGAVHYSSVINNIVIEIYPLQTNEAQTTSGIRLGFNLQLRKDILDQLKMKFPSSILKENNDFVLIQDFDGRKIELIK